MCCPDPYNYRYWRFAAAADLPEDNDPPGPVPEEALEEETGAQCRFCGRTAAGPPEPYCCAGRKRLDLKINAGEHPIFPGPANDQDDE